MICHLGNVLEILPRLVESGFKAQCVVTSPPYWRLRDYGHPDQLGQEASPCDYLGNMVKVFDLVKEVLADDGVLWLNIGDTASASRSGGHIQLSNPLPNRGGGVPDSYSGLPPKSLVGIPWRLAFALQDQGWILRSDIIWHKPTAMPESVKDRPTRSHEYIFMMVKSQKYYYDRDAVAEPSVGDHPRSVDCTYQAPGQSRQKGLRQKSLTSRTVRPGVDIKGGGQGCGKMAWDPERRNLRDVWTIPAECFSKKNKTGHYASFPRRLAEICVKAASRPGDIVFDPFMGSGTTAVVAENLGRQWCGIELNPEYVAICYSRLAGINPLLKAVNL